MIHLLLKLSYLWSKSYKLWACSTGAQVWLRSVHMGFAEKQRHWFAIHDNIMDLVPQQLHFQQTDRQTNIQEILSKMISCSNSLKKFAESFDFVIVF
ncbi:Hypothetical protein CINCED_3A005967 [Cinara cedri]|uniref:Uncharacterized protein n=1 Tax=Cinara cedri TaxID=506608 RepID=A0A5E4NBD4_9HEMI|nr:Hypothetical protein CINCED_3A005967 [Cinara cedri]